MAITALVIQIRVFCAPYPPGRLHAGPGREQYGDVGGLERAMNGINQVALHRVKVNSSAQPRGEARYDRLGVVAGAVEPAVDGVLHAAPERVEQRGGCKRRGGDGNG